MWVDAACATVDTVPIETTTPSARNAAKIASRTRELRWRIAMLSRWVIIQLPCWRTYYKGGANFPTMNAVGYDDRVSRATVAADAAYHATVAASALRVVDFPVGNLWLPPPPSPAEQHCSTWNSHATARAPAGGLPC